MRSKLKFVESRLDEIKEMMDNHVPFSTISAKLNIKYDTLRKNLIALGVEIKTNQGGKGIADKNYRPAMHYIENDICISASKLRCKIIRDGLKPAVCECCGLSEWMGKPIPLELHHIDGNHYNNKFENLQLLCSNCHGQKHLYKELVYTGEAAPVNMTIYNDAELRIMKMNARKERAANRKPRHKFEAHPCEVCGKLTYNPKYCSYSCAKKATQKHEYTKELLIDTILKYKSYYQCGKALSISDKTFKEWCDKYGIKKEDVLSNSSQPLGEGYSLKKPV